MFDVPTQQNDHIFRKVFENFNSGELLDTDKLNLVGIFLAPKDSEAWMKKDSSTRKRWDDSIFSTLKNHPECENWTAERATTVALPTETRVGLDVHTLGTNNRIPNFLDLAKPGS